MKKITFVSAKEGESILNTILQDYFTSKSYEERLWLKHQGRPRPKINLDKSEIQIIMV